MDPASAGPNCRLRAAWLTPGKQFAHPDWALVGAWVEEHPESDHANLWLEVARHWCSRLAEQFGGGSVVYESPNFLAILPDDPSRARRTLQFFEQKLHELRRLLGASALSKYFGKFMFVVPPTTDGFYAYYSDFTDDGEHIQPAGVYLNRGYGHVLFPSYDEANHAATIVHELCHALLVHLPLPLWINEGVTQIAEFTLAGRTVAADDAKSRAHHRAFWTPERIAGFWDGRSFDIPGDSSALSYDLALRIISGLLQQNRRGIHELLARAEPHDAGFAASREVYGITPAEWLDDFLGPGAWATGFLAEIDGPASGEAAGDTAPP